MACDWCLGEFVTVVMEVLHLQISLYGNNYQLNFNNYLALSA